MISDTTEAMTPAEIVAAFERQLLRRGFLDVEAVRAMQAAIAALKPAPAPAPKKHDCRRRHPDNWCFRCEVRQYDDCLYANRN